MLERVVTPAGVVTGETATETPTEVSLFAQIQRPTVVFVYGSASADDDVAKIEDIVFKNEKIGLAMKAFRAVRIAPDHADQDALIKDQGKGVPRLLVIDPVKQKIRVLEAKKIKVSALFSLLKGAAGSSYKENLEKLVKEHLKLLGERDRLSAELSTLQEKETRLADEGDKAKEEIEKVKAERETLQKELEALAVRERELWKLTAKVEDKAEEAAA